MNKHDQFDDCSRSLFDMAINGRQEELRHQAVDFGINSDLNANFGTM